MQYTCVYPNCDEQFDSQKQFRYHTNCHSSGLVYCTLCKQFVKRLDKHVVTQAHISALTGADMIMIRLDFLRYFLS